MLRETATALFFGFVLATNCTPSSADEWYETEGANCSGDVTLAAAISAITGGGLPLQSGKGPGNFYSTISASDLNSFAAPNTEKIQSIQSLDGTRSKSLRAVFLSAANDAKVPVSVTTGTNLITGLLLPPVLGTGSGLIFGYLYSKIDAASTNVHDAGVIIAAGGEVYKRTALLRRTQDDNPFVVSSTEYRVSVGTEQRSFAVQACVYPLAIAVNEFDTTGQFNNKIIKPAGGGIWKQWDIDDKKYDSAAYTYIYQKGGFYYFDQDQIENDRVVGKNLYRISLFGGPFQTMNYNERPNGRWKNFYLNVIAK
jgi:hypothetical protein